MHVKNMQYDNQPVAVTFPGGAGVRSKEAQTMTQWYDTVTMAGQAIIAAEGDGHHVAVAYDEKDGPLIAAAPALLAACKRLLWVIEWANIGDRLTTTEQAEVLRAAISQATGAVSAA